MNMKLLAFISLFLSIVQNVCGESLPIRQTANGPVEGVLQISSLGKQYYAFKGIPYAEQPITGIDPYSGVYVDRRFKPPKPLKRKWTQPLKAYNYGDACVRSAKNLRDNVQTSENCLNLNIYVPVGGSAKKTVLVYIFGGDFSEGNSYDLAYGPDFLIDLDNILVTFDYRVGIFGFLNLKFGEYTGNQSLKDQQMAMKWIYENIEHFSGNQNEILLFGLSSGAASVSLHMLNEESRKYFIRAYLMSAVALNYAGLFELNHLEHIQKCFKIGNDTETLTNFLRTAESAILSNCSTMSGEGDDPHWTPTYKNPMAKDAFFTTNPEEVYNSSSAPVVDALFSLTSAESLSIYPELTQIINLNDTNWLSPFVGFYEQTYPVQYKQAIAVLKKSYYSNVNSTEAVRWTNTQFMSDKTFRYGLLKTFLLQVQANNKYIEKKNRKNTFLMRISVDSDLNMFKVSNGVHSPGCGHGDDVCYVFHCHRYDHLKLYDKHLQHKNHDTCYNVIKRMTKMITNFARNGDPSIEGDTAFKSCTSSSEINCQDIGNEPRSTVLTDIKEQLHYDAWSEVDTIYKNLKAIAN